MSLNLSNITLTYPDGDSVVTALDQVDLDVPSGTLTAVVGPSGSGKSSLLAVAATLIRPDSGLVTIDDVETGGLSRGDLTELRRRTVGIVFQQANLLGALSSIDQLLVMSFLDGRKPAKDRDRAMSLLESVGLDGVSDRRPHQLSGGQRQRLNIARALMNDPGVLLVDEPTSALDHERGAAILDLITQLTHEQQTSTVLVTHDRGHLHIADHVVEMQDGRLTALAAQPAA